MVKKEKTIPSVYLIAVSACLVLYPFSLVFKNRSLLLWCVFLSAVFMAGGSAINVILKPKTQKKHFLFMSMCIVFGILLGSLSVLRINAERSPLSTLADQSLVTSVSGTILSDPSPYGPSLYRVLLRVNSCRYRDNSLFGAEGLCQLFIPGELVRSSLPGGISLEDKNGILYAAGLNIEMTGQFGAYLPDSGEVFFATEAFSGTTTWSTPIHLFRARLRLSLMRVLYDWKDAGGFLLALLSANRDYLSVSLANDFRLAGLAHVLALSGMHLSLIGLVAIQTGKRIGGKRFSIRLSLVAILFFVWFAGASPSLNRALVMSLLLILARSLGFKTQILPVLAATCIIQMMINPQDALTLAYMLSYGALWGILTFGEYLSYMAGPYIPKPVYSPLAASIGAQMMTTPVIALTIGVLSPIGILASCVISPLASIFLVFGIFITFAAVVIPPLSPWFGLVLDLMYRCIAEPVGMFAKFPPLSIRTLSDTIAAITLPVFAGLLMMGAYAFSVKRRSPDAGFARL